MLVGETEDDLMSDRECETGDDGKCKPDMPRHWSAFGCGYESRRAGFELSFNPHPARSFKWEQWRSGWLARREQEMLTARKKTEDSHG